MAEQKVIQNPNIERVVDENRFDFRMNQRINLARRNYEERTDKDILQRLVQILDGRNIQFGLSTGTKIGTATGQKIAFHNATPVVQASHIANPSGQANDLDSEARTAINSILVVLENKGFTAK